MTDGRELLLEASEENSGGRLLFALRDAKLFDCEKKVTMAYPNLKRLGIDFFKMDERALNRIAQNITEGPSISNQKLLMKPTFKIDGVKKRLSMDYIIGGYPPRLRLA